MVEPFSHRIFLTFNHLAQNLKKKMYHLRESDTTTKSFRFFFPMETFLYLCSKVRSGIKATVMRRESSILYYNTLHLEARSDTITKSYLRILNKPSLSELRYVLGDGIGIGISSTRPTKKCKFKYCTVNGKLNSIELGESTPAENVADPLMNFGNNGIDFVFSEESRQLTCILRFTSIPVSNSDIVTSRVPKADVKQPTSGAYVGAWFLYNGVVLEVESISGDNVWCKDQDGDDDDPLINVPLPLACNLINSFGH
jgi:hypothetical protein